MTVKVIQDNIYEGANKTLVLAISHATNSTIDTLASNVYPLFCMYKTYILYDNRQRSLTVIDDDPVPSVSLSCSNPVFTNASLGIVLKLAKLQLTQSQM